MPSFLNGPKATLLPVILGLAYPFLVYAGLHWVSPFLLAVLWLALIAARLLFYRRGADPMTTLALAAAGLGVAVFLFISPLAGLKAYPICLSLALAGLFAWSLRHPPPIIERLARLRRPTLSPNAIAYLRKVTWAWFGFFLVNAGLSGLSALSGNLDLWTLYNGLLSYLLMGALIGGELILRGVVRPHEGSAR
ncbi:MAG TPA: hypothetical protein VKT70_00450 [Stellaceae bacterium]|nr:hypothetical protein [Stellaceae bacterium]